MLDTFTAYASEDATVDGLDETAWVPQYDTLGKLAGSSAQSRDTYSRVVNIGGVDRPVLEGGLHLPLSSDLPAINWEFECIAVGPSSDPSLLGRRWRVVSVPAKSFATARRLDVAEVPQEAS